MLNDYDHQRWQYIWQNIGATGCVDLMRPTYEQGNVLRVAFNLYKTSVIRAYSAHFVIHKEIITFVNARSHNTDERNGNHHIREPSTKSIKEIANGPYA